MGHPFKSWVSSAAIPLLVKPSPLDPRLWIMGGRSGTMRLGVGICHSAILYWIFILNLQYGDFITMGGIAADQGIRNTGIIITPGKPGCFILPGSAAQRS
jgi:hypothetical protein